MEENNLSLLAISKEEEEEIEGAKSQKHPPGPVVAAAVVVSCGTKVKSEPPEQRGPAGVLEPEVLHVTLEIDPTEAAAAAEDVKIRKQQQQRVSSQEDRFRGPDMLPPPGNNRLSVHLNNSVQKEEIENNELNSLGESSLVKLKRRIRLKLLAEEARNSIAKKVELSRVEDEVPVPSTRMTTRNSTAQLSAKVQSTVKDEKPVIAPIPVKVGNAVVDLSSESEDEGKYFIARPKVVENCHPAGGSTYNDALQRLFGPLLSSVDTKDSTLTERSNSIAAAAAASGGPRKAGRPSKKNSSSSELPTGRKVPESVSSMVKMLKKGAGAVAADDLPSKHRQTNKSLKDTKEAAIEESALEYEQERAYNIRRNKEFLAQLGLSSAMHNMGAKKSNRGRTPGSKSHTAATELYEEHHNIDEILLRNKEILERKAAAVAAAVANKRPRLLDSDLDDGDHDDGDDTVPEVGGGGGGKRLKKNPRLSKRTPMEKNEQQSNDRRWRKAMSTSKASSSSGERGRSSKERDKAPRAGRRWSIPASVINGLTASNQELIRFVQELMASAASSLPHTLLRDAGGNLDGAADDSDQSSPRNDQDSDDYASQNEDDSPRMGGESGRKRRDTWLTMIPFETPKTAYELERDEILRRHKDQFERLGIVSELIEEPQLPRPIRPYCRRWASEPDPAFQRNTRFQDRQRKSSSQPDAAAVLKLKDNLALTGTRSLLEVHSVSCASSLVAKFTCGFKLDTGHGAHGGTKAKLEVTEQEVKGFQPREGIWLDPDLTRIYTMDLAPISGSISAQKKGLLAAGGSQGRLAVFAISDDDSGSSDTPPNMATVSKTPLLSWTVDSSWVSQVVFLSNQFQENGTLLLSSSNDGRVVLWDINKQRVRSGTRGLSPLTREGIPVVVCETSTLHSGGIFGMHEFRGRIASSSEGSVAISTIKETGIVVERSITGHHSGVIRSVRFREQNILADCGVDTVIGVLDLRASDPCTIRIQTSHKTGISMIEWSPVSVDSNLVLSASNDPQLYVYDIRYPAKAMLQFEGHVHPRRIKCYSIYRPTFVAGGDAVVTPGEGTHQLTLYSVTTGSILRKLHVGYDPNILLWNSVIPRHGGVWTGCRGITKLQALWQHRGSGRVQT